MRFNPRLISCWVCNSTGILLCRFSITNHTTLSNLEDVYGYLHKRVSFNVGHQPNLLFYLATQLTKSTHLPT